MSDFEDFLQEYDDLLKKYPHLGLDYFFASGVTYDKYRAKNPDSIENNLRKMCEEIFSEKNTKKVNNPILYDAAQSWTTTCNGEENCKCDQCVYYRKQ